MVSIRILCLALSFFSASALAISGRVGNDIPYQLELAIEKDQISLDLYNTSDSIYLCKFSFAVGLENYYSREVGKKNITLNLVIIYPHESLKLNFFFKDILLRSNAIRFSELQSNIKEASCHNSNENALALKHGTNKKIILLETALRTNNIEYFKKLVRRLKIRNKSEVVATIDRDSARSLKKLIHILEIKDKGKRRRRKVVATIDGDAFTMMSSKHKGVNFLRLNNSFFNSELSEIKKIIPGINFIEIYGTKAYQDKYFDGDYSCKERKSHLCGYLDFNSRHYQNLPRFFVKDVLSCKLKLNDFLQVEKC